jgi:hypothetical protein
MNNLYESSLSSLDSNDEETRRIKNQTKINSLAINLDEINASRLNAINNIIEDEGGYGNEYDQGNSSDSETDSDDSDQPIKYHVRIKPKEELDQSRTPVIPDEELNKISKSLKLQLGGASKKKQKIKQKTYKLRDSLSKSHNNHHSETTQTLLANKTDESIEYFQEKNRKPGLINSVSNKTASENRRITDMNNNSKAPPLPPLPPAEIMQKLYVLRDQIEKSKSNNSSPNNSIIMNKSDYFQDNYEEIKF